MRFQIFFGEEGGGGGDLKDSFNLFITTDTIAMSLFNPGGEFSQHELQQSVGRPQTIRNYSIGCDLI